MADAARAEGIDRALVRRWVNAGRLPCDDQKRVRVADLRRLRKQGLDPSRGRHKGAAGESAAGGVSSGFTAVRTKREEQLVRLAEIEVRKKSGQLIEVSRVHDQVKSAGVMIRESLLAIPERLAAVVAAESDEQKIRQLMDAEIRHALAGLVETFEAAH